MFESVYVNGTYVCGKYVGLCKGVCMCPMPVSHLLSACLSVCLKIIMYVGRYLC